MLPRSSIFHYRGIIVGVQQRSSQSSVNKGPQQTLSEIQRGMVARKIFFLSVFFNLISVLIFSKFLYRAS